MNENTATTPCEYALDGMTPSECVVRAVSTLEDVPADELAPLYEVLDPDALDSLWTHCEGAGGGGRISFRYGGYRVTVVGTDRVELDPLE